MSRKRKGTNDKMESNHDDDLELSSLEEREEPIEHNELESYGDHYVREDHFDRFMFGPARGKQQGNPHLRHQGRNQPEQPNIDVDQLMMNIDTLVESVQNLRPLFQKVYPYIEQIWKKK